MHTLSYIIPSPIPLLYLSYTPYIRPMSPTSSI